MLEERKTWERQFKLHHCRDYYDQETLDLAWNMRQTPEGQLLVRAGFEPYDTESSARRLAEWVVQNMEEGGE